MIKRALILSAICGALPMLCISAYAFNLPDSGQSTCYQTGSPYAATDCPGTGQDGAYGNNPMRYADHGDGTVTDRNTGLMWQKCTVGMDHLTCTGTSTIWTWYGATGTPNPPEAFDDVCGDLTLGGYTNWRVPTKREWMTVMHYGIAGTKDVPMIDTSAFPNTIPFYYWSSTTHASASDYAWQVRFNSGTFSAPAKDAIRSVRCVRGDPAGAEQSLAAEGPEAVTDATTGLVWQKGEAEEGAMTWDAAISYCESRTLDGKTDWRLPNIRELEFLGDDTRDSPVINTTFFPNPYAGYYWSSTTPPDAPEKAWIKDFSEGSIYHQAKSGSCHVRCVRGGSVYGDLNRDAKVDLADVVNAMQMLTGKEPSRPVHKQADVSGDRSIGLPEAIYILQIISELR